MIEIVKDINQSAVCREFTKWLRTARRGDRYCYFTGPYVAGNTVGRIAMDAYADKQIILFQERKGSDFAYWAQKISDHWR